MANEKRLIDANEVIRETESIINFRKQHYMPTVEYEAVLGYLKNRPTVDAVEVVRCKDCKWCKDGDICTNKQWQDAEGWDRDVDPEGFCYLGERSCCK